jgi:hypothetical protein
MHSCDLTTYRNIEDSLIFFQLVILYFYTPCYSTVIIYFFVLNIFQITIYFIVNNVIETENGQQRYYSTHSMIYMDYFFRKTN